jgi:hypothetical protein
MACVSLRHLMSITDYSPVPVSRYLGLGIFATLSGYLALRKQKDVGHNWLGNRLISMYLPYWLVFGLMLMANATVHYKVVSLPMIISQILGTTYFTHPGQQLGIHTWFVSLLLVTTLLTVFLRANLILLPIFFAVTCYLMPMGSAFVYCVLAFLVGVCIARFGNHWFGVIFIAGICALLGATINGGFLYPCAGATGLALAMAAPKLSLPRLERWGACTYEYYLIHGPIYLACVKLFDLSFWPTLLIGTPVALLGTWLLHVLGDCTWKKWLRTSSNWKRGQVSDISERSFIEKGGLTRPPDKFTIRRESRCEVKA